MGDSQMSTVQNPKRFLFVCATLILFVGLSLVSFAGPVRAAYTYFTEPCPTRFGGFICNPPASACSCEDGSVTCCDQSEECSCGAGGKGPAGCVEQ
jgi:hypothetical protein